MILADGPGRVCLRAALLAFVLVFLAGPADAGLSCRVVDASEVLRDYTIESNGTLRFNDPAGVHWDLVTHTSDPAIGRGGSGAFHAARAGDVLDAVSEIEYPWPADIEVTIFLLPFPRRELLSSSAGRNAIYLSPGVYPYSAEQVHNLVAHELGHVLHLQLMRDSDRELWNEYRSIRGLQDVAVYHSHAAHLNRPHEILAEDFRVLYGGARANYSGSIENGALAYPTAVSGLRDFMDALATRDAAPSRRVTLSAAPNPFRDASVLHFTLPGTADDVDIQIVDASGRLVRRLAVGTREAGDHRVTWDGRTQSGSSVVSGIYYARIVAGPESVVGKLIRIR